MEYNISDIRRYAAKNIYNFELISLKRLTNEISVLYCALQNQLELQYKFLNIINKLQNGVKESILSINIKEDNNILFEIVLHEKYPINLLINFPKEYPFRPPKVEINNNDYIRFLAEIQGNNLYNGTEKCLCCSTLCCKHNWGPQKDLIDIMNEIFSNLNMLINPIDDILYKAILIKHLGYFID